MKSRMLIRQNDFEPISIDDGDEFFPNGIFEFNITKMITFIEDQKSKIIFENVEVKLYPNYSSDHLDETTIKTANLFVPIILAEIAPDRYNVIDGHHRIEKAIRAGIEKLPAYKLSVTQHMGFLTSQQAYFTFVDYWNSKVSGE